jgi:Rrf2 family protein
MLASSRFAVALHALSILALNSGKGPVCSSAIAESVRTNPVVIRRLMAELERAKIVTSTAGRAGGFQLAKAAKSISLSDVYLAVEGDTVFRMHKLDPKSECPIAKQIGKVLSPSLKAAETALTGSLAKTSLNDVARSIH